MANPDREETQRRTDIADLVASEEAPQLFEEISRQDLLRRTALGGAMLLAPISFGVERSQASDTVGRAVKTLTWGKALDTKEKDPQTAILGESWELLPLVYQTLVSMGDRFNPTPSLARSWEQPSSTSYVFHLRRGVKFSNGRTLVAADVVESFKRLLNPKLGAFWTIQLGPVKRVFAVDDQTVRFELKAPYTPFLAALAAPGTSILPMKELSAGEFNPSKELLGTGPFMLSEHRPEDHWVFVRNPHYWRAGFPKVDRVVVRIIKDDSARLASLRNGAIDMANFEDPDVPELIARIPNAKSVVVQTSNYYFLALNAIWAKSPFRDVRLRRAVALALDRDQIRDVALSGEGKVTATVSAAFATVDTKRVPYFQRDVDGARALIRAAGASGRSFELLTTPLPTNSRIAQVIASQVKDIGLRFKISEVEEGIWLKRSWIDNPSKFQAMNSYYAGFSDPSMLTLWWNPMIAGFAAGHLAPDAELAKTIKRATAAKPGPGRVKPLQEICNQAARDANVIPLVTRPLFVGYRADQVRAKIQRSEGFTNPFRRIEEFERLR